MTANANIVDALKAVIASGNWDFAGELADDAKFVDCLRCFNAPRRLMFDAETPCVYMCLFCAGCWYAHEKHGKFRGRSLADCEVCNVLKHHRSMEEVLALQNLRAAERRYLSAHGWTRVGELWDPPKTGRRFKYQSGYTHNHAVNAQKQKDGEGSQPRQQRNPRWRDNDDE